jgi:toxin ParE1/3/4
MAYAVEFTGRAERDLQDLYEFIFAQRSVAGRRWFNGLVKAIYTLEEFPRRCPRAPESRRANGPLRHLLYGSKPNVYRILFEIDEARQILWILTVRHGARDTLNSGERGKKES